MAAIDKPEHALPRTGRAQLHLTGRRLSQSSTRDLLLIGLAFSSGAVDAISFLALGKVFTAFMTGNVVFLGFGLAGAEGPDVLAVAVSLAAFAVGVFTSARIVKPSKGSGIWPARVSIALAGALLAEAGFLAGWLATSGRPPTGATDLLIALFAFAMGMQSAAVMSLDVEGVFTTAATATLIFLASDATAWSESAVERRRLAGVLVALLVGATAGALLLLHARPTAALLPLVATGFVIATASVVLKAAR